MQVSAPRRMSSKRRKSPGRRNHSSPTQALGVRRPRSYRRATCLLHMQTTPNAAAIAGGENIATAVELPNGVATHASDHD